jgi:mono/diheme cytochrome c family protein
MKAERFTLLFMIVLVIGVPLAAIVARSNSDAIEIHGQMADTGGWTPSDLTAQVGEPLHLRLTSDDVVHGFAVGHSAVPALNVLPGQWTTTTLLFDRPGKYTFYCTRWCGANHWRMRGTIEVTGATPETIPTTPPLYVALNLDLDALHPSDVVPLQKPSAMRGAALGVKIDRAGEIDRTQSPAQVWAQFRSAAITQGLSDDQVWDLIAGQWRSNTTPERLAEGKQLYAQNCAACHGEAGKGDGVIAPSLKKAAMSGMPMSGHETVAPIDFTDTKNMLGASDALLVGKIIRGGMGTGMPYWGPIFTAEQIQAVVDYLWTFQFDQ